jgi:adenylate kinase family enzyme
MAIRLKPAVICFSGLIGAGKSTLATSVAQSFGWPHTSFGDYIRDIAKERGTGQAREVLQQIGEEQVSTSLESFTHAVIARVPWHQGCVIDGLRHLQVLRTLRRIVDPLPVFVVFIDLDESVRRQRLRDRGMTDQDIDAADQHETETQVRTVITEQADLHVNGLVDVPSLVDQIRHFLQQFTA